MNIHKKYEILKNLNFNGMDEFASEAQEMLKNEAIDWDVIAHYMDDDIREFLSMEITPCSNEEFLKTYHLCHKAIFNEDFIIN